VRERNPSMTYLATGFFFAPLRGEPRFEALVAGMHFPPTATAVR